MNAGRLAGIYRWLEYAAFGRLLEGCRFAYLPRMTPARRVLILGEGDGRFLARFLATNCHAHVDVVESSPQMIAMARSRLSGSDAPRVRFLAQDARAFHAPPSAYDLVVVHFLFDCLDEDEVRRLIGELDPALSQDALIAVSEFHVPGDGLARWHALVWIRVMYLFFRWTTGLRVQQIPRYEEALTAVGFVLRNCTEWRWGLVRAELFVRSGRPTTTEKPMR
jgi:ubiquinone/menaquinone biosynthesis C-methylase UbiE